MNNKYVPLFEQWNALKEGIDMEALKSEARKIKHCGDYGRLFVNPKENTVYWVSGDADGGENDGTTPMDEIKTMLGSVSGVNKVHIEAESSPGDDSGYAEVEFEK